MKSIYLPIFQALAVTGALLTLEARPGMAQDAPTGIEVLIELAQNDASQDVLGLPGAELAAVLANASDAQRAEFIAVLSAEDVDALLATLALSGAAPGVIAAMVSIAIENDPASAERIIDVVLQNSAPVALPPIASGLVDDVIGKCASLPEPVLEGIVLAALSFDTNTADPLVRLGNASGEDCAAMLGGALARISETAEDAIASAIETALALEGGALAQIVSELRGEVDVAAIPDVAPPAPTPPAAPLVAPPAVGGGGATPGATSGSGAGEDAIFFSGGSSGTGLGGGPSFTPAGPPFTPPGPPPGVSPVN